MSDSKSSQGRRVSLELEILRQKALTNKQRDRLKDGTRSGRSFRSA
jgi:hypothetical protein